MVGNWWRAWVGPLQAWQALTQTRTRTDTWFDAIRLLAPLGALVVEGWPALVGTLVVQEGGLWLARRFADDTSGGRFVERLFLAAYALRIVIALPTHYLHKLSDGNGALFPDDYTNALVGEWLVRMARGDGIAVFQGHQHLLDGVYPYLLMAIYAIFGFTPLLPKVLNVGLAALNAVLVFELARRAFSRPAALIAALGASVLPSLVVWSIVSLKESLVLFALLLGLRTLQFLTTVPSRSSRLPDALVFFAAVLALLLDLRWPLAVILLGLLLVVYLSRVHYRPPPRQLALLTLALMVFLCGGIWYARTRVSSRPPAGVVEDIVLQIRHRRAQEAAGAHSQLRPEVDVFTATGSELPAAEAATDAAPFTFLGDLVDPLGYALLAPAPWQARSTLELAASGEMLVLYVLLGASCFAWRAPPRQRLFVFCLALDGVACWVVLAATEGNLGNLMRHRLILYPALLILGGAGLEWLWLRAGRPWSTTWKAWTTRTR